MNRSIEHDTLYVHMYIRYCIIIIMIAQNEFLAVQRYPERSMPSLMDQARELEATKAVLPQVLEQGGIFHVFM